MEKRTGMRWRELDLCCYHVTGVTAQQAAHISNLHAVRVGFYSEQLLRGNRTQQHVKMNLAIRVHRHDIHADSHNNLQPKKPLRVCSYNKNTDV